MRLEIIANQNDEARAMNNERSAPQQQHWGATGSIQYTKDTAAGLPVSGALIDWVLFYVSMGWAVLPCRECGSGSGKYQHPAKAPYIKGGFHSASCDPDQIREWWRQWPSALIGLTLPAGVTVIDVDPRNGGSTAELEYLCGGMLPKTLEAVTGRGDGGRHYYFQTGTAPVIGKAYDRQGHESKGIDVKPSGKGYVIAPPSRHPVTGVSYRWDNWGTPIAQAPLALLDAITGRNRLMLRTDTSYPAAVEMQSRDCVSGLVETVTAAAVGNRNNALHWAACRMWENYRQGRATDFQALIDAGIKTGLTRVECEHTLHSAGNRILGGVA